MTREEAVKRIKEIQKLYVFTPTINEALDLAIEALKEPTGDYEFFGGTYAKEDDAESATTTEEVVDFNNMISDCNRIRNLPPVNQKQITGKLESAEIATSEGEESTMNQPKSKLESEQMREYIPKDEVLNIIKSMPMDLVEEYVYELDGIWIDDDEDKVQLSGETSTNTSTNEGDAETATTTDCISRADAIAYIDRVLNSGLGKGKSLEYIKKYVERMKPEDCISRQQAIDEVKKMEMDKISIVGFWEFIESLPPVTPTKEPICTHFYKGYCSRFEDGCFWQCQTERTGEWVEEPRGAICSECKMPKQQGYEGFCANCGAKMGGDTE